MYMYIGSSCGHRLYTTCINVKFTMTYAEILKTGTRFADE